jgi:hypothetical protein
LKLTDLKRLATEALDSNGPGLPDQLCLV